MATGYMFYHFYQCETRIGSDTHFSLGKIAPLGHHGFVEPLGIDNLGASLIKIMQIEHGFS